MLGGDFSNFKKGLITFFRSMLLVLSITIICGLILSIVSNFAAPEASEYTSGILELVMFTIILCFVVLLIVGVLVLLYWLLFVQPSVLTRFIVCILVVALVGFAVVKFTQTSLYVVLCEKYQEFLESLNQP